MATPLRCTTCSAEIPQPFTATPGPDGARVWCAVCGHFTTLPSPLRDEEPSPLSMSLIEMARVFTDGLMFPTEADALHAILATGLRVLTDTRAAAALEAGEPVADEGQVWAEHFDAAITDLSEAVLRSTR